MTNDDLKRLYQQNAKPEQKDDFVRYNKTGNIKAANPIEPDDVVNLQTLLGHEGGGSSANSIWYSRQNLIVNIGEEGSTESTNIAFSDTQSLADIKVNDLILLASGIVGRITEIANPAVTFVALGYCFDNDKIIENPNSVVVDETGVLFEGMTCNNGGHSTNVDLSLPIVGSDTIVVDSTEDGKALELHLDAEVTSKLERQISIPMSAPATTKLVAVDTTNSQEMLTLGTGLTIENGTLNAGGAEKLYRHDIRVTALNASTFVYFTIINKSQETFTPTTVLDYLKSIGASGGSNVGIIANGATSVNNQLVIYTHLYSRANQPTFGSTLYTFDFESGSISVSNGENIFYGSPVDTVSEI